MDDQKTFSFVGLRKPANIWTGMSFMINMNCSFEQPKVINGITKYGGVKEDSKACPINNVIGNMFENTHVMLGQYNISTNTNNVIVNEAISRISTDSDLIRTIGFNSGVFPDTSDPDVWDKELNGGLLKREKFWCHPDSVQPDAEGLLPLKVVNLCGYLQTSCHNIPNPIPSEFECFLRLTKYNDEILITNYDQADNTKYRLNIKSIEIGLPRGTMEPKMQEQIERLWTNTNPLTYIFNRTEVTQFVINKDLRSFITPELFRSFDIPPLFMVICQSQARSSGDYHKSIHKYEQFNFTNKIFIPTFRFELPGGDKLESMCLTLNNSNFYKCFSTKQTTVQTGLLKHLYRFSLDNIGSNGQLSPSLQEEDFASWSFSPVFRCTPLPPNTLNFKDDMPDIVLPKIKVGTYRLEFKFTAPTTEVQNLFVISFKPSIMEIYKNRSVATSFYHN